METLTDALSGRHAVVLGGAGFLGSHLCDRLVAAGARITVIDNLITGAARNLDHLVGASGVRLIDYDVTDYLHVPGDVDFILHFASPASPVDYLRWPIQTLKVGSLGTHKALGLARAKGARLLLASTSEVYGDPLVNPQPESYWGNVNPVGPRGVYDEAKRFSEAMTLAYHREHGVEVRIARIFNSVMADEQVLYDDGRQLRREPVEVLARRLAGDVDLEGYTVPAFDRDGRMRAAEATALVGHPTDQRCFEVTTRYGRSIRVTGDHSLFVEGSDGLPVPRPVNDLQIGDRIAVAARVDVPVRDVAEIDMVEVWDAHHCDDWELVVTAPGLGELVWDHRFELMPLLERRAQDRPNRRQSVWGQVHKLRQRDELPLGALRSMGLPLPSGELVAVRAARSKVRLPRQIPMTDELLWLFGLYIAEGGRLERDKKTSVLHLSCDEGTLDRAQKVFERDLALHVVRSAPSEERSGAIFVHSKLLLALLDHLGFFEGDKRIPGWVLGLPLTRLKWFIEGYREGDGVHSGATFEAQRKHEFSTTSDDLKDDLIVAFARFGLVPSVGRYETTFKQRTGDRRYPFWRLTLSHVMPWSPLEWDAGVEQRLQCRRTGDLIWAPVNKIVEIAATPLVYDFCVPGQENFWAGTGVMAHNTYGPRMRIEDGRAIPAFFSAALRNKPLPVHGDGSQTRSLCYVEDEVEGLLQLMVGEHTGPINIGNPQEVTMLELAEKVQDAVGNHPGVEFLPRPTDDPTVRRPDTTLAETLLGWQARISLEEGLRRTVPWFREHITP